MAVFEQGSTPGGKVQTVREDGYVVELGPLGWLDKEPAVAAFLDGLGLTPLPAAEVQRRRLLLRHGKLHLLPSGPGSFLATPLLRASSKLRLFAEPFIPPQVAPSTFLMDATTSNIGHSPFQLDRITAYSIAVGLFAAAEREPVRFATADTSVTVPPEHSFMTSRTFGLPSGRCSSRTWTR